VSGRWTIAPLRTPPAGTSRWVVRFGGSLLTRPGWPQDLLDLVGGLTGAVTIVVGGGPVVDGLRGIDAAEPMPAPVMHALAIEAMGLTGRLVAAATGFAIVGSPEAAPGATVLDAPRWWATSPLGSRLPAGWEVTSDSIAATVALETASTLVLAKRIPPPLRDLDGLAAAGWVDPYLPTAAAGLAGILWAAPRAGPDRR
jgi:5-(aminomethyl)-3-furanmethanol phosphate kinase